MSSIEKVLRAAAAHGEASDPDMRVGDLEEVARVCWSLLSSEARKQVLDSWQVKEVLEWLNAQ